MTTTEVVDIFKKEYNAFVCQTNKEANGVLKKYKTTTYVYALIADGDIVILGEGSKNRKIVMYPGFKAPSHQKVFIAAAATNVCKDVVRIIIPTKQKKIKSVYPHFDFKTDNLTDLQNYAQISEALEKVLFAKFNFHEKSVKEKNMQYYLRRLEQLGISENKWFTSLMLPLLNSQGSDMGGFKEWINEWEQHPQARGIKSYVNIILGNYYTDKAFNEI